jgi:hypothetical protein
MGSSIWRSREHGRVRTYPDEVDGREGGGCVHYHAGRREGRAGYTVCAKGCAKGSGAFGYSIEATGYSDRSGECGIGAGESVDELREWRDDSRYWWTRNVVICDCAKASVEVSRASRPM